MSPRQMTEKNWVRFTPGDESPSGKTKTWLVSGSDGPQDFLGRVMWAPAWRQYVFVVQSTSQYNPECLVQIASFVKSQTELHRERLRAERAGGKKATP